MAVAEPLPLRPFVRQPLSLRDLLSLVTLLCATLVLLGLPNWGEEERWLIGPAVLATLLGILAGRALKWPAWPLGIAVGTAGAVLGTWLNCRWLSENCNWYPSSDLCAAAKEAISGTAWLGGAAAALIVLATLCAFGLLQWLTSTHARGVIPLLRRYPKRGTVALVGTALLAWCAAHIDRVLWPTAWPVRGVVPFQRGGQRLELKGRQVDLALSHDGRYLATSFSFGQQGCTWLHEVVVTPRRILLPEAAANQQYDCDFGERSYILCLTHWELRWTEPEPVPWVAPETKRMRVLEKVLVQLRFDVVSGSIVPEPIPYQFNQHPMGIPMPPGQLWVFAGHRLNHRSHVELDARGLTPHTWLDFVPLIRCMNSWRQRDYISLLDPATGRELARTQPISPCILNVVLSHDGSTMAVATWEGVYLFDVPKEFR